MTPVQGALTFDWLEPAPPPRLAWDGQEWWQEVHGLILDALADPRVSATPAEMTLTLWHRYGRRLERNGVSKRLAELATIADPPALQREKDGATYRYRRNQ